MTVSIFVSGVIEYTSEGFYTASFRLNDTKSGDPLASKNLTSPDLRGLREQFHQVSSDFYARAPALKAAQPQAAAVSEGHIGGAQTDLELSNQSAIASFDSTPPGAVVLVDGELKCQATPCRKVLALGMHLIRFNGMVMRRPRLNWSPRKARRSRLRWRG